MLQPFYYTLKRLGNTGKVALREYKGFSTKRPTTPTTTDNGLSPSIERYKDSNFCLIFKESCWKQRKATFDTPIGINYSIVYELDTWSRDLNSDFTLNLI